MMVGTDSDSITVVAGQNTIVDFVLGMEGPPPPPPPPPGGTGSVSGVVHDSLGNAVADAMINLMGGDGGDGGDPMHHHHGGGMGMSYSTHSGTDGTFSIANVAAGNYFAMASKMMVGHADTSIVVADSQNTVVNFVLTNMGGHDGGGGMHGDTLEIVNLTGWAIVVQDSLRTHYFLDVNGDDTADFKLLFGPPWYDPGNGAHRPANGDSISISGGLMGYATPQGVVVYSINGLFWRQPGHGHGGHGGHGGGGGYPHPDSLVRIEATGRTIINDGPMMEMYFLDTNYNDTADYVLNFGPPDYNPGNGAVRPNAGDTISIVGGLMQGNMGHMNMIIVYEINGQVWWRDPGDTLGLWPQITGIGGTPSQQLPNRFLVAGSYPNPFNASTIISFDLKQSENVKLTVYDLLGRQVVVLANGVYPAGKNDVTFDSNKYANGSTIYFYRIDAGSAVATGKMILLK